MIALQSRHMELKRLITHFTYRIEPKPGGGFIAHATDPTVPPLEATTHDELQQKIQANIVAGLAAEFPSLKLSLQGQGLKLAFHIERKPGGGFAIHSADPGAESIEAATSDEVESHFAEKLIGFLGKHFMPELSQAIAQQGNSGDIKVFVNRGVGLTLKAGSHTLSLQTSQSNPATANQPVDARTEDANPGPKPVDASFSSPDHTISNSPITPETSSSWKILGLMLAVSIISVLIYFFVYHG